jgi:hypothetical protein
MQATPMRLLNIVLWPLTIWPSVFNLEKHPADNYAERTFPLIATAIGFWVCVGLLTMTLMQGGLAAFTGDGGDSVAARLSPGWADDVTGVLWFFLPALYIIGVWLYAARDEAFPS